MAPLFPTVLFFTFGFLRECVLKRAMEKHIITAMKMQLYEELVSVSLYVAWLQKSGVSYRLLWVKVLLLEIFSLTFEID